MTESSVKLRLDSVSAFRLGDGEPEIARAWHRIGVYRPAEWPARPVRVVFGLLVIVFSLAAFLAPPFSGLDTLPALGVVVMSLGFLLTDFALVLAGAVIGCLGIAAVIGLGGVVVRLVGGIG